MKVAAASETDLLLANAVIAGTNKAGTTSLFRYLSDHPEVCASRIKEITFFSGLEGEVTRDALAHYAAYFSHCGPAAKIRLEASPNYLTGGARVACLMRQVLPDAKLIFILREPVSRLMSNFQRRKERMHQKVSGIGIDEYVDILLEFADSRGESGPQGAGRATSLGAELESVLYVDLLRQYLAEFPCRQVKVMFFDDLVRDTRAFVRSACTFLEIDEAFYDDYEFGVENKTRAYRSKRLQQLAFRVGMRMEGWLNRTPTVRRTLRDFYNLLNAKPAASPGGSAAKKEQLRAWFMEHNRALGEFLRDVYPAIALPAWIPERETVSDPVAVGNYPGEGNSARL